MLVLTRRVDESIRIGDNIRITVVKIKGTQQICVGVDAPRDVLCCEKSCSLSALRSLTSQNHQTLRSCQSSGLFAYHGNFSHTRIA